MPVDVQTRDQAVNAAIREIGHIATLPEITLKIIQLVESPSSTAQDLHKVISNDPALCSRILKVVNSAFYGLPGQIGSINRAIVLLGLNAVKNIAIAASLTKLFRGGAMTPGFSARDLWDHSMVVATTSKVITDTLKMGFSDEAFLAGLIHDIGIIVEIQFDRHKLIKVLTKVAPDASGVPTGSMLEIEEQEFGANHQDFGTGLCARWKFPKSFANVTGFHHHPLDLPADQRTLPTIIAISDRIAAGNKKGFRLDLVSTDIPGEFLDAVRLTREQVEEVRAKLPQTLEAVEKMLS